MTIIRCEEEELTREGAVSGVETSEKRTFIVESNSVRESIYTIVSSPIVQAAVSGGPLIYLSVHPQHPYSFVKSATYTAHPEGRKFYRLIVNYDSKPITQQDRNRKVLNPLERKAITRWDKRKEMIPADRDIYGNPLVSVPGEYFDPPPERAETIWIYRVEKNVPVPPTWLADYEDSVNDAVMYIYDRDGNQIYTIQKGCGKLIIDDMGDMKEENEVEFVTFKFSIELKTRPAITFNGGVPTTRDGTDPTTPIQPDGWDLIALHHGFKELDSGGNLINIKDDEDATITAPYPLDDAGAKITGATAAERRANIIFLVWDQFQKKDFSVLQPYMQ